MKHHIIVKFNDSVSDKTALISEIETLFAKPTEIAGIHGISLYKNCVDRSNRFDLMIVIHMDAEALPLWDASPLHKEWKDVYGHNIAAKAIFDCE